MIRLRKERLYKCSIFSFFWIDLKEILKKKKFFLFNTNSARIWRFFYFFFVIFQQYTFPLFTFFNIKYIKRPLQIICNNINPQTLYYNPIAIAISITLFSTPRNKVMKYYLVDWFIRSYNIIDVIVTIIVLKNKNCLTHIVQLKSKCIIVFIADHV